MRNLYVVSHTHWDREWYMPYQLFRLKLIHLVDGLLDILKNDSGYKYFMLDGQTIILEDYLQMRPEKESVLQDYIRKGRIIIGPWHILPDMFLVSPEAHIRNLLQGDRTARRFGPKMMVGYMPDSFGHIGQAPQILRGFGIETASLWRGVLDGTNEFWWQAPDGSRVLMAYLREGYGNGADLPTYNLEKFASMIKDKGESLAFFSATPDLLIMFGTDHMEPPVNTSAAIAYADKVLKDIHVVHSTLPQYIAAIQSSIKREKLELPTIAGELRACKRMHLLPGVLSTRMWIKQRNHTCETLLEKWVEPFSTFAELIATEHKQSVSFSRIGHPSTLINQTWRLLMENHPHDSICGCSIDEVHDEMKVRFNQVEQVGEEITRQSLESIAICINTDRGSLSNLPQQATNKDQMAIVIFNPSPSIRSDYVTAAIELPSEMTEFELIDEEGNSVPYQEHGLGSHEIFSLNVDAPGLKSALSKISDGRAVGMTVQDIKVNRLGADVFIDSIMANGGEPNLAVWETGRKEIIDYFSDPTVTSYHVRARSTPKTQVQISIPNIPGYGYKTLWVRGRSLEEKAVTRLTPLVKMVLPLARLPFVKRLTSRKTYARPPYKIENEHLALEASKDGTLTILDKETGNIYWGLNRFLDSGDCGDEYNFCPPIADRMTTGRLKHVSIFRGPVQQTIELELELPTPLALAPDRKSRSHIQTNLPIKTIVTLTKGVSRVDISTVVENQAIDHRLRVHFPVPFTTETAAHDGHFEVVERKVGIPTFDYSWVEYPRAEVPQRVFTSITDGKSGLTVANRGLTEVEVLKNAAGNTEIAVTLMRCVGWLSRNDFSTRKGHAGPNIETPGAQMLGKWNFNYSIIPHAGDWLNAYKRAYEFDTPLRYASTNLHHGSLPGSCSFLKIEPETFVISAVKQSDENGGWLVRGYNITGEEIQVTLESLIPFRKVVKINLAENKQSVLKSTKTGCVTFPVRGHEIVSVLFKKNSKRSKMTA